MSYNSNMPSDFIINAVKATFDTALLIGCAAIGSGYYGKVYSIKLSKPPYTAAIKIYNKSGDNEREALWYLALKRSGIPLPEIYGTYDDGENCALLMSLINASSATDTAGLSERERDRLGYEIAEIAARLHSLKGSGYGAIDDASRINGGRYSGWKDYYIAKAKDSARNISRGAEAGLLGKKHETVYFRALEVIDKALDNPPYPSLIHGDLNTDNILIDKENLCVAAVIDPIASMWGDSEYELFQLDCASGKEYGLLNKYARLRPLSENYSLKSAIYAALAEGNHYCNIGKACDDNLRLFIDNLEHELDIHSL